MRSKLRFSTQVFWLLAGIGFMPVPGLAGNRLRIPDDFPGPPAYMELETAGEEGFTDLDWVAIPIYREPTLIPLDFNLLEFLDDATFERFLYAVSVPLYVEGSVVINPTDGSVEMVHVEELPGMQIWFVRWDEFQNETADGQIYIDELVSMSSLLIGAAELYMEHLKPGGGQTSTHSIVTSGTLEDGRSFFATYAHGSATNVPGVQVQIRFD